MKALRDSGFRSELPTTLKLAAPLALGQLAQVGMGLTDTIMLGGLGSAAIGAGGLSGSIFWVLLTVLQGFSGGVSVMVAHARGAQETHRIAAVVRCGLAIAAAMVFPLMLIMSAIEPVLIAIGEPPGLAADVAAYCGILAFGAPGLLWLGIQRLFLASMNHPRMVMAVAFVGLGVNVVLNYGLIYGQLGLPEMGLLGSATATCITMWGMAIATFVWTRMMPALSRHLTWGPIDAATLRHLLWLGWPMAITFAVEALLFLAAALMMGTLGVTALAAHQVAINIASTTFMVPLAVSQAANVRVAYHLGAQNPRAARAAGGAAFVLGVGFMAAAAIVMFVAPESLARLFQLDPADPADAPVVAQIVSLMLVAAVFQVFDGAQVIAVGALRGLQDTRVPMWIAGAGYWLVGFPAAWALGFFMDGGPTGIWWGLAAGLLVVAIALSVRFERLSAQGLSMRP